MLTLFIPVCVPLILSISQVKRATAHLDRELSHLEIVRRKLSADIVDKAGAIDVDTKVVLYAQRTKFGTLIRFICHLLIDPQSASRLERRPQP